jgi:phosphoribosyl 1,2-cyclic phosphodiesterase
MKIAVAGCRGSLPSSSGVRFNAVKVDYSEFGGNTSSYYIRSDSGKHIIVDAGSGIRNAGEYLMSNGFSPGQIEGGSAELYITHTHWDHIQGFPFFTPAYIKGNKIRVFGEAKVKTDLVATMSRSPGVMQINGSGIRDVLTEQQNSRNFPVPLTIMGGLEDFFDFLPGANLPSRSGMTVETNGIQHPGGCVSYAFVEKGKRAVICSDFEPDGGNYDSRLKQWWQNADLVIADGQYEPIGATRNKFMKGWGHSTPFWNVDLAGEVGVKRLLVTHHDPTSDDSYLRDFERRVKEYARDKKYNLEVGFVREGDWYEL